MLSDRLVLSSVLILLAAASFACAGASENEKAAGHSPNPGMLQTVSPTRPPLQSPAGADQESANMLALWQADSLETLVSYFPEVIVGHVERLVRVEETMTTLHDQTFQGVPISVYEVSVQLAILSSGGDVSKTITFRQAGDLTRNWGPLPVVGQTYLFFLQDLSALRGEGSYTGPFFARFVIDTHGMVVPNGWEREKGIAAVSGVSTEQLGDIIAGTDDPRLASLARRTVDQVAQVIQEVAARVTPAPSPAPIQTATPTPAPSPAAVPASPTPTQPPQVSPTPAVSP